MAHAKWIFTQPKTIYKDYVLFLFKQISAIVLLLSASSVFANTIEPIKNKPSPAWDIGASALYLKPSLGGYVLPNYLNPTSSTSNQYTNWSPGWGWGYKIEGSYHINHDNDLKLSGYHISNSNHFVSPSLSNSAGVIGLTGSATSNVSYNWNAVNLEFGQVLNYSPFKSFRFHGGLAYARVATDTLANFILFPTDPIPAERNLTGTFNGFGPRLGMDAIYGWRNGFSLYANTAMSLLIGSKAFSDTLVLGPHTNPILDSFQNGVSNIASVSSIAYGLEAKLGAKYTHVVTQGALTIDGGWMCVNYINALEYRLLLSARNSATREANFAIQGPYVGMKWSI